MSILHVTDAFNRANTGITQAIRELLDQSRDFANGLGLIAAGKIDVAIPSGVFAEQVPLSQNPLLRSWNFAPDFGNTMRTMLTEHAVSIVHIHGTWLHQQFAGVRVAKERDLPVVLTNHGHLEAWALRQPGFFGALKKKLYLDVMSAPLFSKVDVFHAISPLNRDMVRRLFPSARIELIPNAIDIGVVDRALAGYQRDYTIAPHILFMGRLAPQKGVDLLIQGFGHAVLPPGWKLILAGPVENEEYAVYLNRLIAESSRRDAIEIKGPVWDLAEKFRMMANAWVVAVPSRSEAVGLVNLEASACRTPTITTFATGLLDWGEGGGLLIEPNAQAIARSLSEAAAWSDAERMDRGAASRALTEARYSTQYTAGLWAALYSSLR